MISFPLEGEARLLLNMVQHDGVDVRLFMNDLQVDLNTTLKDLVTPKGMLPILLKKEQWKVVEGSDPTEVVHPFVRFVFNGALGRVYGYAMVQGRTLLLATRIPDSAPFIARVAGDELKVRPRVQWKRGSRG